MCVVCGCSNRITRSKPAKIIGSATYTRVERAGEHDRDVAVDSATHAGTETALAVSVDLDYGQGRAKVTVPGMSQSRIIRLEQDVLGENNRHASLNRRHFIGRGMVALNLVSSPGSGKTSLLCATISAFRQSGTCPTDAALTITVIEGDQQTSCDADRIRATGVPALQINTGKGCHLDAHMVAEATARLTPHYQDGGILFIENVGNLVCPAMWDLGEFAKVVVLSVTEGEDKPLKYPDMFAAARLMILNKIDLLPYVQFDVERCMAYARSINPGIEILQLSATSGQGMQAWLDWITSARSSLDKVGSTAIEPA